MKLFQLTKARICAALLLLGLLVGCCSAALFSAPYAVAAAPDSGKYVINDYETYNAGFTGPGMTVQSTEPCNPYGVMISTNNAYAAWNTNFQYLPFKTDWSGARYVVFYIDNTAEAPKSFLPVLSMNKSDNDRKHFYPTAGVYLDDMQEVTPATIEGTKVQVPALFKGYVKIELKAENFAQLWGNESVQDFSSVMQMHFFDGDAALYADTVAISYDDDIQLPLTMEEACFGRALAGSCTVYALKDFYWMMRGDDWFDGANGAGDRATYDAYGQYMTYNNAGNTAAVTMWQKDTLLVDWGLNNWDGAKYLVVEVRNNDPDNDTPFGLKIDAGANSYNLNWYGDYMFRGKDGSIVYRDTNAGTDGKFIVPGGFDGYLIVDFRMFAYANDFTADNMLSEVLYNVKRVNLDFGTEAIDLTFGMVGYTRSDLIRYADPETNLVINDESRYMSAEAENMLTPVASFLDDSVPENMTANMGSGVTVTKADAALNFKGTPTANGTAFANTVSELEKLNTAAQNLLVLDIKNNLQTASYFKPYIKTYNNDITDDTQDANFSVAYGARVHLLEKGGFVAEMQITADGITLPAGFEGYVIVPFSTMKESDTSTGRDFRADKIKALGIMPLTGAAVDFDLRTPYLASSIKVIDTEAEFAKLPQDELLFAEHADSLAYGATYTPVVTGGQGNGAVTYSITAGSDYATLAEGVVTVTRAGGSFTLQAVKAAENDFYGDATATVTINTIKAVPQVSVGYSETIYRGANSSTLTPEIESAILGTATFENKVLAVGENSVQWTFTPEDAQNYETVTGTATLTAQMPPVSSVTIVSAPAKTSYEKGQSLDLTGLSVKVTYADGTEETAEISAENVTGYDSSKVGEQTVTVTIGGKTAAFQVTVTDTAGTGGGEEGGCSSSAQSVSAGIAILVLGAAIAVVRCRKRSAK